MRYTFREGAEVKKKQRRLPVVLAFVSMLFGGYLLYNTLSPALPNFTGDTQTTAKKLKVSHPVVQDDRIYMPQINVDVAIVEIGNDETAALDKGAIHREPTSGNPKDGGNFVIAAHRFTLGMTPEQTRLKSPFYHIDQLSVGDQVYIDYGGTRYAYEIQEKKQVSATAVEIEQRTKDNRLTIYSCELSGARDGREVIVAKPIGTVAWQDGKPKIEAL